MKSLAKQAAIDRKLAQRDLYYLCKEILGYKDMVQHVHGDLCQFATNPRYGRFRQACVPRSWFKTWTFTIGTAIWMTLPDEEGLFADIFPFKGPNVRILIASNVIDNAAKMVNKIKAEWENNERLKAAFPELVPSFNKTRWSDHCAQVRRTINATEGTYTAVGVGGSVISQHFDLIIEDDLIYAKKDDFTGSELMPNQEDIDNAIGWHKLAFSLLINPKESCLFNVGTRWAPHDLIDYIRSHEKNYKCFEICVTKKDVDNVAIWPIPDDSFCLWPERYDKHALDHIRNTQGPRIFETQYLNRPRAGEDVIFALAYLKQHDSLTEFPDDLEYRTFVDLASWGDKKRLARNVVLTGAKDIRNHIWVARVDAGRFNPSEIISLFKQHSKQFNSKVRIEEIQYQRAIRHFAKLDMEHEGNYYNIDPIPYDGRKNAKELRIQALEPVVKNGCIHVLGDMRDLIQEMEDYPYGATCDILDCLGYLFRHAPSKGGAVTQMINLPFSRESIEKEIRDRFNQTRYPFSVQLGFNPDDGGFRFQ